MDDPLLVFKGTEEQRLRLFAVVFLWFEATGFPVAWHKVDAGKEIDWIGGRLERRQDCIRVSIPEAKALNLAQRSHDFLQRTTISKRDLRSYAGAVSFVAGLVIHLTPFLASCWAAVAARDEI